MQTEEMRLDGNAAAGTLREIFARDMTAALARCSACGDTAPMATLLEYGHAMGVVLRCPSCDSTVLRVARTPGWIRVDAAGVSFLMIPENLAAS